jgi:hypothetical protein
MAKISKPRNSTIRDRNKLLSWLDREIPNNTYLTSNKFFFEDMETFLAREIDRRHMEISNLERAIKELYDKYGLYRKERKF